MERRSAGDLQWKEDHFGSEKSKGGVIGEGVSREWSSWGLGKLRLGKGRVD